MENTYRKLWKIADNLRGTMNKRELNELIALSIFVSHKDRKALQNLMQTNANDIVNTIYDIINGTGVEFDYFNRNRLNNVKPGILFEIFKTLLDIDPIQDSDIIAMLDEEYNLGTPAFINELMVKIADIGVTDTILDPTFGLGTIYDSVLKENSQQVITGQEINDYTADLAKIRLYCLGASNAQVYVGNSLTKPIFLSNEKRYSRVIMHPPFGLRATKDIEDALNNDPFNRFTFGIPPRSSLDWAFIMTGLSGLEQNGKGVFLVSNSTLFMASQVKKIRDNFLAADLIEAVIGLPEGLLYPYTNIPTAILVINKDKKHLKNHVRMINATKLPTTKEKLKVCLTEESIEKILTALNNQTDISGFAGTIRNEDIRKQDSILVPEHYIKDTIYQVKDDLKIDINMEKWSEADTFKLVDVAEVYRGFNVTAKDESSDGKYDLIKISNISDGKVDYNNLSKTNVKENTRVDNYQIESGDILLSVRGTTDKLAYIDEAKPNTLLTSNLVGIRPNKDLIEGQWLFEYLNSPLGLAELDAARVGTTIAQIPMKGLANIKVPRLSLSKQQKAIEAYSEKQQDLEKRLAAILAEMNQIKNDLYEEMGISKIYEVIQEEEQ